MKSQRGKKSLFAHKETLGPLHPKVSFFALPGASPRGLSGDPAGAVHGPAGRAHGNFAAQILFRLAKAFCSIFAVEGDHDEDEDGRSENAREGDNSSCCRPLPCSADRETLLDNPALKQVGRGFKISCPLLQVPQLPAPDLRDPRRAAGAAPNRSAGLYPGESRIDLTHHEVHCRYSRRPQAMPDPQTGCQLSSGPLHRKTGLSPCVFRKHVFGLFRPCFTGVSATFRFSLK